MKKHKNGISDRTESLYKPSRNKYINLPVSDTIYTFDIETTSLFDIDGKYQVFDYSRPPEYYKGVDKVAVPYIWMFGVEDDVYYGRDFFEFEEVLKEISSPDCYKIIWVHNLSFEMVFLQNIFDGKYTIENMCARSMKAPIQFTVKELNIIFRCSYMLTNLSLDKASKEYTNLKKRSGEEFNYHVARSPLTKLSEKQMEYCEYDIRTLHAIICHFRTEYEHLFKIPLTATGIIRQELREHVDYWYIKQQQNLVPDAKIYLMLWASFSGGYTHANCILSNRIWKQEIESQDEASAYPAVLCTEKYPCGSFIRCRPEQYEKKDMKRTYAFLFKIELNDVKCKYFNTYIQYSKCNDLVDAVVDNGRIRKMKHAVMIVTDVDYEIIRKCYSGDIKILEAYKAKKDYLDERIIKFILHLYGGKTKLKDIIEKAGIYRRDKGMLNSCYGMSVTNPLKQSADFKNGVWSEHAFTKEFIEEKLNDMKKSYSTLFYFATGCWCTAYARRNIWKIITSGDIGDKYAMDKDVIYCDTDSVKFRHREQHQDVFLSYNNMMIDKYRDVIERYDSITLSDFMPSDKKGVLHPIGFFEFDGLYTEFITLGAKKYCYREDGELHITVSGVSKKGVKALNDDIRNFKKGFVWDYFTSGKNTHFYREKHLVNGEIVDDTQNDFDFEDVDGNIYHSTFRYSLVLMPTTYKLGITEEYENIIKEMLRKERLRNE